MSTVVIKVDGVDVTSDVVITNATFTGVADGNVGMANIQIDDRYQQYSTDDFRAGMTLQLFIDGTREWDGWVIKVGRAWPFDADDTSVPAGVPRFWNIAGHDRNYLFQKRVLFNTSDPPDNSGLPIWPEDTADRVALLEILNDYVDLSGDGLTFDIENIASPGPFEEFTLAFISAPLGAAFEDAAKITGGVFWIGPDRTLYYKDDLTVTAPWALSDNPTAGQKGYREFEAALDFTHAANEALVWGAGKGSDESVFAKYTNQASVDTHGLFQWGDLYVGAWKQQTVNRRARTYVIGSPSHRRGHDEPVPIVRFTMHEPGLRVGMVVDFESEVFGYSEPLPVREVTITFPTEDEAKFDYQLTLKVDSPFTFVDLWKLDDTPWDIDEVIPPEGPNPVEPVAPDNLIDHYDTFQHLISIVGETIWASTDQGTAPTWTVPMPEFAAGDYAFIAVTAAETDANILEGSSFPDDWTMVYQSGSGWAMGLVMLLDADSPDSVELHWSGGTGNPHPGYVYIATLRGATNWTVANNYNSAAPEYSDYGLSFAMAHMTDAGDGEWLTGTGVVGGGWDDRSVQAAQDSALGVSTAQDYDGNRVAPDWNTDATYEATFTFVAEMGVDDDGLLRTPGQEITGAAWAGGNVYENADEVIVEDSVISKLSSATTLGFDLNDTDYELTNTWGSGFLAVYEERPWSGFSTAYHSGGVLTDGPDLLVKWKFASVGDWWGIDLSSMSIPQSGATPGDVWLTELYFVMDSSYGPSIQNYGVLSHLSAASHRTWPQPVSDPGYADPEIMYPSQSYYLSDGDWDDLVPDTWYWTRITLGAPNGYGVPYVAGDASDIDDTGLNMAGMKTWLYGEPEPDSGDSGEFDWYWLPGDVGGPVPSSTLTGIATGGWDIVLPTAWAKNYVDEGNYFLSHSENQLRVFAGSLDDVGIDGIWKYSTGLDGSSGVPTGGQVVTDVPLYDNSENTENGLYLTTYPYAPGSLVVYYEGIRLQPNVDYWEVDPSSGSFRVASSFDVSSALATKYRRGGTTRTSTVNHSNPSTSGGGVYTTPSPYVTGTLAVYYNGEELLAGTDYTESGNGQFTVVSHFDDPASLTITYTRALVYRPAPQLMYGWGTPLDGYNAMMAASAMALDRHTSGSYTSFVGSPRSTPVTHRGFQSDQSGRADLADVVEAWSTGWGETFWSPGPSGWDTFVSRLQAGRGAILEGDYGDMPSSKRFSTSYTDRHDIYVNEVLDNGNFWAYDPLSSHPIIYTVSDLQSFAYGLAGTGLVRAGYTQVT